MKISTGNFVLSFGTYKWSLCLLASAAPRSVFIFQAEAGIRDLTVTGVQTCALPILIGQAAGDVLLVPAQPLPPDIAGVHCGGERNASSLPLMPKDRDREPRIDAVARHHRELVARRHRLTGGVARGGEGGGRLERGSRVAVVRVRPYTPPALPPERGLHPPAAPPADVLEVTPRGGPGG